ncbi:MAG: TonB-dependent receptor [gamma proteobacterium symbiont of Bathyaustriella thionipta]|nr:TonB-dependent receptor [gamma proteobacterium symbiont of Bathyaustriella thionipta]MCU7948715.1 TonB-dependent receptor [gamma proteobacterium symbiont of Bathyaustriella thionipta]MCU7954618.1 TonB-dependent receptor [gamma proteobacterium symbiont of Bathyaustriella thionipta]MCU7955198.1 TonB-dependent receptor [gamma proteobacterium symbiont of Bathyaustriella thionipta]
MGELELKLNPNKRKILIGSCCLLLNSFSYAASNDISLLDLSVEELSQVKVIIATGTEQTIDKAPATVTVISAEDIKKTGATNLTDVLESVPGVHINSNSFGSRPLVHMRGTGSFQTLLMVNGNDTRDLVWAFGIFWKGIPVSAIERIEVIRGPGSALYGADASAGVINVITKTAGKIKDTEVGLRAGSFDTQAAFIQSGGNWNGFDLGITAEFSTTDGHDPSIKADRSNTPGTARYGWDNQDLRFSIARDHWQLLANYIKHDDLETGMAGGGYFDSVTSADDERFDLDLIYKNKNFSQAWGVDAKLHYQDLEYSSGDGFQESPPDALYPDGKINHMSSAERQISFEASGLYSGFAQHSVRIGAGYDWQDLYRVEQQVNFGTGPDGTVLPAGGPIVDISDTVYAFAPEKTRKVTHLFVQDVWNFADNWGLTAGARYDHYSDFGDTINPRVALTWKSTDKLITKLLYGQGFRAPSFQELYAITSRSLPNSDLDPEESETLEIAFSYAATKDLQLGMNIFNFEISDFISRDNNRQFQNSGRHKILGVEMEAQWQAADNLGFSGNYTYRDPDDNDFRQVTEA